MELYEQMLAARCRRCPFFDGGGAGREIEGKCYQALKEIRKILSDDELKDDACFEKIEKIVSVFESLGSDCGNRHDFG